MPFLKKMNGDGAGQLIELRGDSTVIGRFADLCQIVLESNSVSRKHTEIKRQGENFVLIDLESRNKTKLNGVFIAPNQPQVLHTNDKIGICDFEFVYHAVAPRPEITTQTRDPEMLVLDREEAALHTLDASRTSAMASAVRPEAKLSAILDISRDLGSDLNIDTVSPKILDSLMKLFPSAERSFLILLEKDTNKLIRKAFKYRPNRRGLRGEGYEDEAPTGISRTIVNHVINQKKAVLSQDVGKEAEFPVGASIADLKIRSVMCVPLLRPDGPVLGILQLDSSEGKQFKQDDLDVLAAVASQAAIAIENASMHQSMLERDRIDRDMNLAREVQKRFLPQSLPKYFGYQFFAFYNPAYEVGGDYYDFVPLADGKLGIALADAAGKGVAAALMMAKFSGDTRFSILTKPTPAEAANDLNQTLCDAGFEEKFITMSLNVLDTPTATLTLASAGHMPVMIRRSNGTIEEIGEEIGGFPLGIMPGIEYEQTTTRLRIGDVAVIFSDGVTDARSTADELFHTKENPRLLKVVREAFGPPDAVGKAILQAVREFSLNHPQADDITLICFGPVAPETTPRP